MTGYKIWSWASAVCMIVGALGTCLSNRDPVTKLIAVNLAAWGTSAAIKIQKYNQSITKEQHL